MGLSEPVREAVEAAVGTVEELVGELMTAPSLSTAPRLEPQMSEGGRS
jgi:hypothetical protein